MFKRKCKITFVTHGATVHSIDGIISNNEKYPKLNDLGENEIEKVCEYLENRGVPYDKIYSSTYARCTQSAEIIAKLFKKRITTIDLSTRNYGEWEGQSIMDVYNKYGESAITQIPKGGESLKKFNKRVNETIEKLVEENRGNRIIVVTTPDVVRAAIANTLDLAPESQFKLLIKTGSITQISYFEDDWSSIIYSDYIPV